MKPRGWKGPRRSSDLRHSEAPVPRSKVQQANGVSTGVPTSLRAVALRTGVISSFSRGCPLLVCRPVAWQAACRSHSKPDYQRDPNSWGILAIPDSLVIRRWLTETPWRSGRNLAIGGSIEKEPGVGAGCRHRLYRPFADTAAAMAPCSIVDHQRNGVSGRLCTCSLGVFVEGLGERSLTDVHLRTTTRPAVTQTAQHLGDKRLTNPRRRYAGPESSNISVACPRRFFTNLGWVINQAITRCSRVARI